MAIAITHAFVSGKADPPDASLIKPSNWNANHTLTMGTGKLVGRTTAASGAAEEISVGGALTFTAQTLSLPAGAITNAYLNDMATQTIKGRTTLGAGDPEDLTAAQVTAMLDTFSTILKGLVPASGGGTTNYLRADGSWAAPPGAGLSNIANSRVFGNASGSPAIPYAITASEVMDMVGATRGQILYRGASGWAPLSVNTAGFVLRDGGTGADPTWVGGMTKINSGTMNGSSANLDITLPTGYLRFRLYLTGYYAATDGSILGMRVSYDNGSTFQATNYSWTVVYGNTQAAATVALTGSNDGGTWAATGFSLSVYGADNTAGASASYVIDIEQGANGTLMAVVRCNAYHIQSSGSYNAFSEMRGNHATVDIIDAVRILFNSGNATGSWSLYGIT